MTEPCSICGGSGVLPVAGEDLRVRQCRCVFIKQLRIHLGPEISSAPTLKESPFYKAADGKIEVDLSQENLFIECSWAALLPHLKYLLSNKGLTYFFRVITDEMVKRVFVGATSYKSKSIKERESEQSYNGLADLVEAEDLVIVRFGFLGYPNRAVSGATKETLLIREAQQKPTWLVSTPNNPFSESHAYSPDLGTYIEEHFKPFRLDSVSQPDEVEDKENAPGMGVVEENETPPEEERALEPQEDWSADIINDTALTGGKDKWKKSKKRWND